MSTELYSAAWARRPSSAVSRLAGRPLCVLSARDLLKAALHERRLLIALVAPAPAAIAGFARAARDSNAPLVLLRPSGAPGNEKGPEEARDDAAFVEAALRAAEEIGFGGPMALLKEAPRPGTVEREHERLEREIDAGFTGLAVALDPAAAGAEREAVSAAAHVCSLELGLEVQPLGGTLDDALRLLRELRSRGAPPSAVRLTGHEGAAAEQSARLEGAAICTSDESAPKELAGRGVAQLVASRPFLRALQRSAPRELLERMQGWSIQRERTLEQAAARHQKLLRDLPAPALEKLEALCCFEAAELFEAAGVAGSSAPLLAQVGRLQP
jgi:hypothetical protein